MTEPEAFRLAPQEYVAALQIDTITEHPANPNQGDDERVSAALDRFGFYGGILVQKSTRHILAGHTRWRTARAKGAATIPGFLLDVDDGQAEEIIAWDNLSARLAVIDEAKLVELLNRRKDAGRLDATGYTEDGLLAALRRLDATGDPTDPSGEWENMPDFENPDRQPAWSVHVHFPDDEAVERFMKLLGREPKKVRSLWWPETDGLVGSDWSHMEVAAGPGDETT